MHLPYAVACAAQVTVACVARRRRGVVEAEVAGVVGVIVMVRLQARQDGFSAGSQQLYIQRSTLLAKL